MADDAGRELEKDVSGKELEVLQALWEKGTLTRRQITDVLYPGGGPAHYTTVQKLLERLEEKGCVRSRLHANVRLFTATIRREQLIRHRLRDVADKLCGGSLTPLLMNLVREGGLSEAELKELRQLIRRHSSR
jgi:BlaI family transcriptional regulator, penicillinase repressor